MAGEQDSQHGTSQRTFSKRRVVSNWDRYHEGRSSTRIPNSYQGCSSDVLSIDSIIVLIIFW